MNNYIKTVIRKIKGQSNDDCGSSLHSNRDRDDPRDDRIREIHDQEWL